MSDDARRLGSAVSFGEFVSGEFGRPEVPDAGEFAKRLARDLVVDVSSVEAGSERLGRGGERLVEEGVSRRSFGDFLAGAGLVGAGVLGSLPAVPGPSEARALTRLDDIADALSVRSAVRAAERGARPAPAAGSGVIRRLNEADIAARERILELGRDVGDGPGAVVRNMEPVVLPSQMDDLLELASGVRAEIDAERLGLSRDFVVDYFREFSDRLNSNRAVAESTIARSERLSKNLWDRNPEFEYSAASVNEYDVPAGDGFQNTVNKKLRIGVSEADAAPAIGGRSFSPSYGPILGETERISLVYVSAGLDSLHEKVLRHARVAAQRAGFEDDVARLFPNGLKLDGVSLEAGAFDLTDEYADVLKFTSGESVPLIYPIEAIYDAMRILFEPRINAYGEHKVRIADSLMEPDFLWFGYFNKELVIGKLREARALFDEVDYDIEQQAEISFYPLLQIYPQLGRTGFGRYLADIPDRAYLSVLEDIKYMNQNKMMQEFAELLRITFRTFKEPVDFKPEKNIERAKSFIDDLIELLQDDEKLIKAMTDFETSPGLNIESRFIVAKSFDELEPADNDISRDLADGVFNRATVETAIETEQVGVPSLLDDAILMGPKDGNPLAVRVFSPLADAEITGSQFFLSRVGRASLPYLTGTYASYSDVFRQFNNMMTSTNMKLLRQADTNFDYANNLIEVSGDVYTARLPSDLVDGFLVPDMSSELVDLAGRNDFFVVVRWRRASTDFANAYVDSDDWYAEIDWYRGYATRDEARAAAVRSGHGEIVDTETGLVESLTPKQIDSLYVSLNNAAREAGTPEIYIPKITARDVSVQISTDSKKWSETVLQVSSDRRRSGRPHNSANGPVVMDSIARMNGFDGKPHVVSSEEYRDLLAAGWRPVYRGVMSSYIETDVRPQDVSMWRETVSEAFDGTQESSWSRVYSSEEYYLDFISGDYSSGRGVYASGGFYFADEIGTSFTYSDAADGVIIAGLVPPYARFAPTSLGQVYWGMGEAPQRWLLDNPQAMEAGNFDSLVLALMGYDGAYTNIPVRGDFSQMGRRPEMVIFNRTMLAVYDRPLRMSDWVSGGLDEFMEYYGGPRARPATPQGATVVPGKFRQDITDNIADWISQGRLDSVAPASRGPLWRITEIE